jgi:ubiquinone/menaquinone biosynthesis C-methylase UbiE
MLILQIKCNFFIENHVCFYQIGFLLQDLPCQFMSPSELQHSVAQKYADAYQIAGPRIEKVRRIFAAFKERKKVLDVGCADGSILLPFVHVHELHGVDISESLAAKANASGIQTKVHDLLAKPLPYPDKLFDVVFSGETIEHHVDTDWMLSEINRVLKPGGILILTFPNIRTALSLGMMLFDLPPMYAARYRAPHYRDFTLHTIKMALKNHGFALQKSIGSSFFLPKIGEYGSWLATFFPSWSNTTIVVSVKKCDSTYSAEDTMGEIY